MAGNHEKVTVILACKETGEKHPPAIITKSGKKKPRIKLVNGVLVFENPGTSMANSNIMTQWIKINLPGKVKQLGHEGPDLLKQKVTLLIMDSFRGHLTDQIKDVCESNDIVRAIIPGGLTSKCQPLDLTVNRSFKSLLKTYYRKHGLRERKPLNVTNKSFNLNVLTKGVHFGWNRVKPEVIRNGFKAMYESKP